MNEQPLIRQPNDANDFIWRYMDLPKFVYLLGKRRLYLARADKFDDLHEGAIPEAQHAWERNYYGTDAETVSDFRYRQKEWTFISCWSHNNHESHALWRIFCGTHQGVAVRSRYLRLMELMRLEGKDEELGLVDYGRSDHIPQNSLVPFFRKRKPFAYEQEARFVVNVYSCHDARDADGNLKAPLPCLAIPLRDLNTFVEAIRIHPEADQTYFAAVRLIVEKLAPELQAPVQPSEMAASPLY